MPVGDRDGIGWNDRNVTKIGQSERPRGLQQPLHCGLLNLSYEFTDGSPEKVRSYYLQTEEPPFAAQQVAKQDGDYPKSLAALLPAVARK